MKDPSKNTDELDRIAENLLIGTCFLDDIGLYMGKTGIAIFFCHYARFTNTPPYMDFAGELIDEVYADIDSHVPIGFETGISGIGWGIGYLLQHHFMEGDPDEILAALDETVIAFLASGEGTQKEREGTIPYILSRLNTRSSHTSSLYAGANLRKWFQTVTAPSFPSDQRLARWWKQVIKGEPFAYEGDEVLKGIIEKNAHSDDRFIGKNRYGLSDGYAGYALKKCLS